MKEYKYKYTDPYFLNKLVMFFGEDNCGLSAFLKPDIQEFIDAAEKARLFTVESCDSEINKELRERRLSGDMAHAVIMLRLCKKHNILPFWSLIFDYDYRQFDNPKIDYSGYSFYEAGYEPHMTCVDPTHFTKGSRWYSISFNKAREKENVKRFKRAIGGFIGQGYRVTSLSAKLKPRIVTRGCCESRGDYEEYDASLWASKGKIEIHGEIPEDFDLEKIGDLELKLDEEQTELLGGAVQKLLTAGTSR